MHLRVVEAEGTTETVIIPAAAFRPLDAGRIPFHRAGAHRRVLFKRVTVYRAEHRRTRCAVLYWFTRRAQELGLP